MEQILFNNVTAKRNGTIWKVFYRVLLSFALMGLGLSVQAKVEPQKLYGIAGHPLIYMKVGNKSYSYKIKGVVYYTKTAKEVKNFTQEGIASYYHNRFNGRKNSSGERHNQNAFTAAHKTLPHNSYVLVTNLRNGRKVIVRINDRGPFVKDRIIDLSKVAAREIGIIGKGIGKVRLEILHIHPTGKISGPAARVLAKYAKNNDAKQRLDLKNLTNSQEATVKNNANGTEKVYHYRVHLMNLDSKKQAENMISQLKLNQIQTEIIQRGKKYDVYFSQIMSKEQANQLKLQLRQIDRSAQVIVFVFN
ncbi:septal ring lytic transglycosylase RlpA family protein [Seminibacterium arietis]|uniref:Endolytic peptidoglycan transglycosylase RlpA n=1 Tax=Seminibacterium arietis TaxID=1173502 RepID=A0ABW3IAM6_9PAST